MESWPAADASTRGRDSTCRQQDSGALDRTAQETEHHPTSNLNRTTTFSYEGLTNLVTQEIQENSGATASTDTKTYNYDTYGHRISLNDKLVSGTTTTTGSYTRL